MMKLGNVAIGKDFPPFIIAEMSGNHNKSLETALRIVEAAALSGAHALKIQTYKPETMTLDLPTDDFRITDVNSLWHGKSLFELFGEASTPWEWHAPIFAHAKKLGLIPFSTAFDKTSVDFLEELDVPFYKIASFENTDVELIKKIASTKKPIIMSTGMASIAELSESVAVARDNGCSELVLLKCTSTYPASAADSNILTIPHMRQLFECEIGLSDHTMGLGVSVASIALGATVIEKHFTLDRRDGGVDSTFSIEPSELKMLVNETHNAWSSLGGIKYGPTAAEIKSLKYRRSLYALEDINPGDHFSKLNVGSVRPGLGLPVKYLEKIIGKTAKQKIAKGAPISWAIVL